MANNQQLSQLSEALSSASQQILDATETHILTPAPIPITPQQITPTATHSTSQQDSTLEATPLITLQRVSAPEEPAIILL
ncbi:17938_t:CDS:2, partial [Acaulospora morrowiae]